MKKKKKKKKFKTFQNNYEKTEPKTIVKLLVNNTFNFQLLVDW